MKKSIPALTIGLTIGLGACGAPADEPVTTHAAETSARLSAQLEVGLQTSLPMDSIVERLVVPLSNETTAAILAELDTLDLSDADEMNAFALGIYEDSLAVGAAHKPTSNCYAAWFWWVWATAYLDYNQHAAYYAYWYMWNHYTTSSGNTYRYADTAYRAANNAQLKASAAYNTTSGNATYTYATEAISYAEQAYFWAYYARDGASLGCYAGSSDACNAVTWLNAGMSALNTGKPYAQLCAQGK